ncbi:Sorting nexin-17 [Paramecium bursaria]
MMKKTKNQIIGLQSEKLFYQINNLLQQFNFFNFYFIYSKQMKQSMRQRYQVSIRTHELIDKKVYYHILITNTENGTDKLTKQRFSQLEQLHQKIQDWISLFKIKIPPLQFPKKKMFGSTNNSEESIKKRRQELTTYFDEVLSYPELHSLSQLEELLPKRLILIEKQEKLSEMDELKNQYKAKLDRCVVNKGMICANAQYYFQFEEHQLLDDCILYHILARDLGTGNQWKFTQRYRDLKQQHKLLQKQNFSTLPEFPEKQCVPAYDPNDDLKQRKKQLSEYLNKLFCYPDIQESEVMKYFIVKSQIDGNEVGCRSKGVSNTTLENSSIKTQSQREGEEDEYSQSSSKSQRRITC